MLLTNIIQHINLNQNQKKESRGIYGNQVTKFLLIIDNAESLIEHDAKEFKEMIAKILNECQNLNVIITSRRGFNSLPNTAPGKMIFLDKLSALDSVEVFLDQTTAGSVSA
jgi:hypothetical protein